MDTQDKRHAVEWIFPHHYASMQRAAGKVLGHEPRDLNEALHNTFCSALKHRDTVEAMEPASVKRWLVAKARGAARRLLKSRPREQR